MLRRRLVGLLLGASLVATSARAREQDHPTYEITFERAIELVQTRLDYLELLLGAATARVELMAFTGGSR